jgi:putative ABC transport system permease protein
MNILSGVVIGIFLLAFGALVVLAVRRPLLARLAFREAVRRPGQSALVVLGLMVGTIAVFGMQVLADSLLESETQQAYLAWGHVDLVAADGGRFFDPSVATGLAADPGVRSSFAGVQGGVELPSSVTDLDRNNVKPLVVLVGFDPATQAPFGSYLLSDGKKTTGQDLAPGEVLVSSSLATALEARTGDRLRVSVGSQQSAEFHVAGIATAVGPGAYTLRPALFSPLINLGPLTGDRGINVIRLAAPGQGRAELDRSHELAPRTQAVLQTLPGAGSIKVGELKRSDVDAQVQRADGTRDFFTVLSLFIALAGVALVVNLGLALAEERRPRHAVLRALGLGRTGVVTLSVLEGAIYSIVAAAAALLPGAIFGFAIIKLLASRVSSTAVESRTDLTLFSILPASVAFSIAVGALVVLTTLFATSIRTSRMQISSAIKNLPEPPGRTKRSMWRTALLASLGLASLAALVVGNQPVRMIGGVGLIVVAASLVRGRISDRLRGVAVGAALAVWAITGLATASATGPNSGPVLIIAAVTAVFGMSLIVAGNLRLLEIPLGWFKGGARATLAPSLAYITRRPLRAGLGTGAFAMVLTMMTFISVIFPTFLSQFGAATDEYDVRVSAPTTAGLSLPDSVRPQIARAISMPTRPYRGDVLLPPPGSPQKDIYLPLYALSSTQLAGAPFQLASREARFKNDAEAWQAVADDPHLVVSPTYNNEGQKLDLIGPDGPVHFEVVGATRTVGVWGLVGSEAAMSVFTTLPVGTTILAKTAPGADARAVARQIQREVFSQGAEATTVQEMFDAAAAGLQAFEDTTRVLMGIGLLVGVLSLGILALRAVIERRRAIGMLRSLGYRPGQVLAGIISEAVIVTTSGALVGFVVGLALGIQFRNATLPLARIEIDGTSLALIVGAVYLAVLAVTIVPAMRAARLPAALALRLED